MFFESLNPSMCVGSGSTAAMPFGLNMPVVVMSFNESCCPAISCETATNSAALNIRNFFMVFVNLSVQRYEKKNVRKHV